MRPPRRSQWKPAGQISAEAVILNPHATRQEILGFGAAMTDATCYVLSRLTQGERDQVLHDIFDPSEMAMNVCRTSIGASDYSRTLYSYDESDTPDPELKKFSIDYDKEYILPILRECRKHNSGSVSVLLALEPARLDEARPHHARRRHALHQLRSLCALFRQVP